ncbi:exported protein [Haemophilus influenzae]|uniref:Exported protein n=1 Tax=Haemophilus influenzae TaxID=727 RepID=A0A2X1PJM0_HAEIF|nr:exported protein [Haemophilus influenzae]
MAGFLFSGSSSTTTAETKKEDALDLSLKDLSPEELRSMGLEGDTSKDTVRNTYW